ncbi:MAG: methylated-DNA--[protein]-cysteine S-methyltransferase [Microbacteriaceae bacterium]|nr:methylated-DNA--[protein]-cysteine S-methyltransferase [Microbacteriaceae bacterium]
MESLKYTIIGSPIGDLLLAKTRVGMVRVAFEAENIDLQLRRIAESLNATPQENPQAFVTERAQFDKYFAGQRREFQLPLDHRLTAGFRLEAQQYLANIPYGETRSYGELAASLGSPGAARAVGTACATNPLPLLLPCHRVVRADGSPGQFAGGTQAKLWLLSHETKIANL